MTDRKQRGFSLLELMVAMMIIAVIGTLGFRQYNKYSAKARYVDAHDKVKLFSEGLDQYYLKHGKYPDISSWEEGVSPNSPLVKESMIAANMPTLDPWKQPYEVKSGKGSYEVKCLGDPNNQEEFGEFSQQPGRVTGPTGPGGGSSGAPAAAPAEGGAGK